MTTDSELFHIIFPIVRGSLWADVVHGGKVTAKGDRMITDSAMGLTAAAVDLVNSAEAQKAGFTELFLTMAEGWTGKFSDLMRVCMDLLEDER